MVIGMSLLFRLWTLENPKPQQQLKCRCIGERFVLHMFFSSFLFKRYLTHVLFFFSLIFLHVLSPPFKRYPTHVLFVLSLFFFNALAFVCHVAVGWNCQNTKHRPVVRLAIRWTNIHWGDVPCLFTICCTAPIENLIHHPPVLTQHGPAPTLDLVPRRVICTTVTSYRQNFTNGCTMSPCGIKTKSTCIKMENWLEEKPCMEMVTIPSAH